MASNCPRCGAGIDQAAAFCPSCGTPLAPPAPPTVPMPTVSQPPQVPGPQDQYPATQYLPQQSVAGPGAADYGPAPAGNRTVVIVMAVLAVVAVIGAVVVLLTNGGDDSAGPAVGTTTSLSIDTSTSSSSSSTSSSVLDTTVETTASTVPATSTTFPTSVPAGQCTSAAVTRDTGLVPTWGPSCDGPWLITDTSCDSTIECEGVDVMRWVEDKWQYRGYFYAMCATRVTDSGMPPTIAKRWFGSEDFCAWERNIVTEPASGPLEIGDKGERVKAMQTALISLGVLNGSADGEFGPTTRAAVIDFQFLKGLTADGIAGANTHAALGLPYS